MSLVPQQLSSKQLSVAMLTVALIGGASLSISPFVEFSNNYEPYFEEVTPEQVATVDNLVIKTETEVRGENVSGMVKGGRDGILIEEGTRRLTNAPNIDSPNNIGKVNPTTGSSNSVPNVGSGSTPQSTNPVNPIAQPSGGVVGGVIPNDTSFEIPKFEHVDSNLLDLQTAAIEQGIIGLPEIQIESKTLTKKSCDIPSQYEHDMEYDFSGCDFSNYDLSHEKLEGNFESANFSNAILQNADLEGNFESANFSNAILQNADLEGNFESANFSNAILNNAGISGDFDNADFSYADLSDTFSFGDLHMNNANLTFALLPSPDDFHRLNAVLDLGYISCNGLNYDEMQQLLVRNRGHHQC